jgi:hypothetical protein
MPSILLEANAQKIQKLLQQTSIAMDEQYELLRAFSTVSDQGLQQLVQFLIEDPSTLEKLNENFKSKKLACITNNTLALEEIVVNEVAQLKACEA